ncbi:MAG: hypothetical protein JNK04_22025 [Myxococcales bacterium]|nr:hypothetical protein [Myxococcales bacterium]
MFEAEATARRASLPTVPESEARPQASSSAGAYLLDQPKLTWAVDLGEKVLAMSTFDLWYALSAGDIAGDVKVWRVGREAWTCAVEVPELACALADVDELIPARQTLDYVAQPPSFGGDEPTVAAETERGDAGSVAADSISHAQADDVAENRDSHTEISADELEGLEMPEDELCEAHMGRGELTPSADLPMGQVISLHPSPAIAPPIAIRRSRAIAAAFAVAATLAVGFSFLVAFAAPSVGAEAAPFANAALLPATEQTEPTASPLFDMEADALAEASARRVSERLSSELVAGPAEVIRRVKSWRRPEAPQKSWSPSEAGQQRKRVGKGPRKTATDIRRSTQGATKAGPKRSKP